MFIDLRGPTLKTLHACTGVSTGKNEQRRRPLEMRQQAMVLSIVTKFCAINFVYCDSVTKIIKAKILFARDKNY